jgi:hypothetical protein
MMETAGRIWWVCGYYGARQRTIRGHPHVAPLSRRRRRRFSVAVVTRDTLQARYFTGGFVVPTDVPGPTCLPAPTMPASRSARG